MQFLVAMEKSGKGSYGVVVPALPGCFSAGDTVEEALVNAQEAILLHIEGLLDAGETIPEVDPEAVVGELRGSAPGSEWIVGFVRIDAEALDDTAERINVSMPRRVLHAIDRAATAARKTRSGFLAEAGLALATRLHSERSHAIGKQASEDFMEDRTNPERSV